MVMSLEAFGPIAAPSLRSRSFSSCLRKIRFLAAPVLHVLGISASGHSLAEHLILGLEELNLPAQFIILCILPNGTEKAKTSQ